MGRRRNRGYSGGRRATLALDDDVLVAAPRASAHAHAAGAAHVPSGPDAARTSGSGTEVAQAPLTAPAVPVPPAVPLAVPLGARSADPHGMVPSHDASTAATGIARAAAPATGGGLLGSLAAYGESDDDSDSDSDSEAGAVKSGDVPADATGSRVAAAHQGQSPTASGPATNAAQQVGAPSSSVSVLAEPTTSSPASSAVAAAVAASRPAHTSLLGDVGSVLTAVAQQVHAVRAGASGLAGWPAQVDEGLGSCTVLQALEFEAQCRGRLDGVIQACLQAAVGDAGDAACGSSADAAAGNLSVASQYVFDGLVGAAGSRASGAGDSGDVASRPFRMSAAELRFLLAMVQARERVVCMRTVCTDGCVGASEAVARVHAVVAALPREVPPRFAQHVTDGGLSTSVDDGSATGAGEAATETQSALKPGWAAVWDPASKAYYYAHTESGEVTWEVPLDTGAATATTKGHASGDAVGDNEAAARSGSSAAQSYVASTPASDGSCAQEENDNAGDSLLVYTGEQAPGAPVSAVTLPTLSAYILPYAASCTSCKGRDLGGGYFMLTFAGEAAVESAYKLLTGAAPSSDTKGDWAGCRVYYADATAVATGGLSAADAFVRYLTCDDPAKLFDVPAQDFGTPSPEPEAAEASAPQPPSRSAASAGASSIATAPASASVPVALAAKTGEEAWLARAALSNGSGGAGGGAGPGAGVPMRRAETQGTVKHSSRRRQLTKMNPLVNRWMAVAQEEQQAGQTPASVADPAAQERAAKRKLEEWRAQQIRSGKAQRNPNFTPVSNDWKSQARKRARLLQGGADSEASTAAPAPRRKPREW